MMTKPITSRHFKEYEFQRCSPPCSLQDMDQGFMDKMDATREDYGKPLTPTSAYRSPAHDKSKGRSGTGDHPQHKGLDVTSGNGRDNWNLRQAAEKNGITRIGISKKFTHLGDGNGAKRVLWTY
jgi:hypothetical protein